MWKKSNNRSRKRLLIISGGTLPLPSIRGGGVETLCTHFINMNEKTGEYDLLVISCTGAEKEQTHYHYAQFVNFEHNEAIDKLIYRIDKVYSIVNERICIFPPISLPNSYENQVCRLVRKIDCDAILVENTSAILQWISSLNKAPIIYHAHYDDVNNSISDYDKKRFITAYKNVSANISVSDFINGRISSVIKREIDYYVVKNCIDYKLFSKAESPQMIIELKQKLGIPQNQMVFAYAGRITREKGLLELIKAFNMIKEKACLLIAGGIFYSNNESNEYLKEVKKEASRGHNTIIFTGYINHEKMNKIWKVCDVAVIPTIYVEEAAGLVVIEAMAANKPVVISNSGAMSEYMNENCGFICKRGDDFIENMKNIMENLIANPQICISMGEEGQRIASQYNIERYFQEMSIIIDRYINK